MSLLFPFAGLGYLIYCCVLILNGIAVLSEDRFLARIGWGRQSATADPGFGARQDQDSMKTKIVNLISSVRTLTRVPLIVINTVIIVYELLAG